jgi:hypothetical protein
MARRADPEPEITYDTAEYAAWLAGGPPPTPRRRGADPVAVKSYSVPSADEPSKQKRPRGPSTTMIRGSSMERGLIAALRVAAWLLIVLSIIGTFYGGRGQDAPILQPWRLFPDVAAAWGVLLAAAAGQGLLTLLQWGSRRAARSDPRWWLAYLAALAPSVWWNWQAYGDPLMALGVPVLIAWGIIIGGDMFPELTLVRNDD